MAKTIQYFLILFFTCSYAFGQQPILVTGKVVDNKTNEPISFVNIGIEGTLTGTASNQDGEFSLKISDDFTGKKLYFSAIGYENYMVELTEYLNKEIKKVALTPLSYDIDDIQISTASKVLYRIVRDAAKSVNTYFVKQPYACKAIYTNESYSNQVLDEKRNALALITDNTGYGNSTNAFSSRNYKFINVQRNFSIKGLANGTTQMDDLLSLDISRTNGNILDTLFLSDYDLKLVDESKLDQEDVWIIAFNLNNPGLNQTGDFYAKTYQGRLIISKTNNVLLKIETNIKAPYNSPNGRSVAVTAKTAQKDVDYNFSATYKNTGKGYALDRIMLQKNYSSPDGQAKKQIASLKVLTYDFDNPAMLTSRQYFENMVSDPDFWTRIKSQFQLDESN